MIMAVIGAWLSGSWTYAFWYTIQHGEMAFVEPNKSILLVEFWLAVLLTVSFTGVILWSMRR